MMFGEPEDRPDTELEASAEAESAEEDQNASQAVVAPLPEEEGEQEKLEVEDNEAETQSDTEAPAAEQDLAVSESNEVDSEASASDDTETPEIEVLAVEAEGEPEATDEAGVAEAAESDAVEEKPEPVATKKSKKNSKASKEESKADDEEEDEDKPRSVLKDLDPERAALPWYPVHTYSGYENRVKLSLEERVRSAELEHKFGNIVMPQETVEELVRGKKKQSSRKLFPGYIMVQMHLDDETWHLVNATPKVTGFVGDSRKPLPLTEREVKELISQIEGGASRPKPRVQFEQGDAIKVVDGPFADFNGTVDDIRPDKGKLRVLISIFGRNTPVELDFVQVEKM